MKTEEGGGSAAPRAKDAACHILINAFIWRHLSSCCCCAATETLRLRGDGDLRRRLLFSLYLFIYLCTILRPPTSPTTHGCVSALQQRLGVPEQQPVVRIHDVGLGLFLLVLRVRLVEGLLVVLVSGGALRRSPSWSDWTAEPQSHHLSQR